MEPEGAEPVGGKSVPSGLPRDEPDEAVDTITRVRSRVNAYMEGGGGGGSGCLCR